MARSYPKSTFTRSLPLHLWVGMFTRMWATRAIVRESVSQIMYMRVCICVYEREIQTETQCSKTAASLCNDINGNYKLNFHQGVATSRATYHWYPKMGHRDHLKKEGRPQIPMTTWKKKSNQSILGHPWKHNISSTFPKMFFMQLRSKLSTEQNKREANFWRRPHLLWRLCQQWRLGCWNLFSSCSSRASGKAGQLNSFRMCTYPTLHCTT